MKRINSKVDCSTDKDSVKAETDQVMSVSIDANTIDAIASKIVERLVPVLFVCSRVASRDTIKTPMRDLRAIFKDIVEEAEVAHTFYADSLN